MLVLGRPDWAADPRFATNADRLRHRAELTTEIEQILTRDSAGYWQQALDGAGIPASPVLPPAAALTSALSGRGVLHVEPLTGGRRDLGPADHQPTRALQELVKRLQGGHVRAPGMKRRQGQTYEI